MIDKHLLSEDDIETREWLDSLDYVLETDGPERVKALLRDLQLYAYQEGVRFPFTANTPYVNTIHLDDQPPFPGNRELERRIKSIVRWNAMAMVVRANQANAGLGGHISTFASSATLYEVGFNHFFRNAGPDYGGDFVYFQGHASPGIYARAFMEGRIGQEKLENFRRELQPGGGLSSYPHPRLMPDFWQFPTVSMGLGPITGIYHARFLKYLENRGLKPRNGGKVWVFMGDGESDEPESLGAIGLAARENLDNLVFVVNCNLQRLDGPVRGNGKIIQELEGIFRGAGWHCLKVIWGNEWDPILEKDTDNILKTRMEDCVDGQYQKFSVETGAYIREHFFGAHPGLESMVDHLSDERLEKLNRGGHDPEKVYAAYKNAIDHEGSPTVIIAKTIKGYGLGESGEGKNITHQQKKLNLEELREFRTRFNIPISEEEIADCPFYLPAEDSPEMKYLHERRAALGGYLPERKNECPPLPAPPAEIFQDYAAGSDGRSVSTTKVFGDVLRKLLRDKEIGKYVVPIIPDEARTFGLEPMFRQVGIYSSVGQLYEPVDSDTLLYYKESKDGQILEEGINEAGSMSSFIAAGSAYVELGIPMIPFYIYYSMFGPQRVGDLMWLAGDKQCRGFLLGGTAGRTTLNGEGLQHQDGHSHVTMSTIPNAVCFDPAFAYEVALLVQSGIRRMYVEQENVFYYMTLGNEDYEQPAMPEGVEDGIVKGLYRFSKSESDSKLRAHLLGSGAIMNSVLKAQALLEGYGVATDVWSVTSYTELRRDGLAAERWNLLHPGETEKKPYVTELFENEGGVAVAASDYMKCLPDALERWFPLPMIALGTDGYGKSETREALRDYFEVDERFVTIAALTALCRKGDLDQKVLKQAFSDLNINPDKPDPMAV